MAASKVATTLFHVRNALQWSQRQLADGLGTSVRTLSRMESGQSPVYPQHALSLAAHLYPVSRDLTAELLHHVGQTLVSAGLEAPPAPPAEAPVPARPPPPAPERLPLPPVASAQSIQAFIDAIVCAVADSANEPPKAVRPAVLQTLRKVVELGLDVRVASDLGLLRPEVALPTGTPDADDVQG